MDFEIASKKLKFLQNLVEWVFLKFFPKIFSKEAFLTIACHKNYLFTVLLKIKFSFSNLISKINKSWKTNAKNIRHNTKWIKHWKN